VSKADRASLLLFAGALDVELSVVRPPRTGADGLMHRL
jgi:hypothetical protein